MNVQFAVKDETVYVLEVNPRASRTVPFVSKAIGRPLAKMAAKIMTGVKLRDLGFTEEIIPKHYSLKEAVFPVREIPRHRHFARAGNEIDRRGDGYRRRLRPGLREIADGRATAAADERQPSSSACATPTSRPSSTLARGLQELGFWVYSTSGTASALRGRGHPGSSGFSS